MSKEKQINSSSKIRIAGLYTGGTGTEPSQSLSGWMGSVAAQLFSGLSRDVQVWALARPEGH